MRPKHSAKGVSIIKAGKKLFRAILLSCLMMTISTSCAKEDDADDISSAAEETENKPSVTRELDKNEFFFTWNGEKITPNKADENGLIRIGSDTVKSQVRWDTFSEDVRLRQNSTVTITDGDSITKIETSMSGDEYIALIQKKIYEDGRAVSTGQYVSPAKFNCVQNKDTGRLEYYFSDCLVYTCPADTLEDTDNSFIDTPAEFKAYPANPDAGVTFPFQKRFSSRSDFDAYYEKYNSILGLSEMKEDIDAQESEGVFNTNVFFLYADMADNDSVEYEFLRAVQNNGELTIYLKRSMPVQQASGLSKWQLVCKVPSEYLHEIDPNNITWVIYNDVITKG